MKVLAIVGSPRKNGNTDVVVQKVLEGATQAGAETETIYINELDFKGCQGCGLCNMMADCKLKDDMTDVYVKLAESDAFVFGSPIYFGQFTGQMRLFLDRCYALVDAELNPRLPVGKNAVLVRAQGEPDKAVYESVFDEFESGLNIYFGMKVTDKLVAAGVDLPGASKKDAELMEKAKAAGVNLVK